MVGHAVDLDGPPDRHRVQRRHRARSRPRTHLGRRLGQHDGGQPAWSVPDGEGRPAGDRRRRVDGVHRLDRRSPTREPTPGLRRVEGGSHRALPTRRSRRRPAGRAGERGRARTHRHPARPPRQRRSTVPRSAPRSRSVGRVRPGRSPRRRRSCSPTTPPTSPVRRSPSTVGCPSSDLSCLPAGSTAVVHPGVLHPQDRGVLRLLEATVDDLTDEERVAPDLGGLANLAVDEGDRHRQDR